MKFVIWTREDRNRDNPVNVEKYDGYISFSERNVHVLQDGVDIAIPLKDLCMIDFDFKEYM